MLRNNMVQEEKQLLVKALRGYWPYGVICSVIHKKDGRLVEEDMKLSGMFEDGNFYFLDEMGSTYSDKYIPYLRPMSSMTEEERNEYLSIKMQETERVALAEIYRPEAISEIMDWLDSHYFDYRGLIQKGLALEAPFGMYK